MNKRQRKKNATKWQKRIKRALRKSHIRYEARIAGFAFARYIELERGIFKGYLRSSPSLGSQSSFTVKWKAVKEMVK